MIHAYGQDSIFKVSAVFLVPGLHYDGRRKKDKKEERTGTSFRSILRQETESGEQIHQCITNGYTRDGGKYEFIYSKREYRR